MIEKVQYDLSYTNELKSLNLISMEWSYDRYRVFYTRKILGGLNEQGAGDDLPQACPRSLRPQKLSVCLYALVFLEN